MNETVWSVNILIGIGLMGVIYVLYYILTLDNNEVPNNRNINNNENVDK